ncbi:hypothetical protein F4779DRAFT_638825 [Xylariaceae sp. FL0662B]|nr:hypothetical protein F4779DRAFT_638825 [Xylariaceae sp. FL0662B]
MSSSALNPLKPNAAVNVADCGEENTPDYPSPRTNMAETQEKFGAGHPASWNSEDLSRYPSRPLSQAAPVGTRGRPVRGPLPERIEPGRPGFWRSIWENNKAPLLMLVSQLFAALMNLAARLVEVEEEEDGGGDGDGLHPMQLLFLRMALTTAGLPLYIWWRGIPHGVLGPPEIRWLLGARGVCGFFGIYGMWYSVMYLPLAEATVITFLSPVLAGYLCHVLIHDPFTRTEQLASFLALAGVVLVTRPVSLFSGGGDAGDTTSAAAASANAAAVSTVMEAAVDVTTTVAKEAPTSSPTPTSAERLSALGMAFVGVLGGAGAITSLRWMGSRAHPLISVHYFSALSVTVTGAALAWAPAAMAPGYALPRSPQQWALVLLVVACGVVLQVAMAAGLAAERSHRATAVIYSHVLFAAALDYLVFGHALSALSAAGCALVVAGALWVALADPRGKKGDAGSARGGGRDGDVESSAAVAVAVESENVPMLDDVDSDYGQENLPLDRLK